VRAIKKNSRTETITAQIVAAESQICVSVCSTFASHSVLVCLGVCVLSRDALSARDRQGHFVWFICFSIFPPDLNHVRAKKRKSNVRVFSIVASICGICIVDPCFSEMNISGQIRLDKMFDDHQQEM
jgi:hypothetical protein